MMVKFNAATNVARMVYAKTAWETTFAIRRNPSDQILCSARVVDVLCGFHYGRPGSLSPHHWPSSNTVG